MWLELAAAVAGAYMQQQAAQDAAEAQARAIEEGLARQDALSRQAEERALKQAKEFAPETRQAKQGQLEEEITANLIAPVSESQAIRAQQQSTQGNVSDAYTTAKAKSDLEAMKNAESLARLLGKTAGASRLRMNEGIGMVDAGMDIDRFGNFAKGEEGVANVKAARAAIPGSGAMIGSLLQAAGTAGLMSDSKLLSMTQAPAPVYAPGGQLLDGVAPVVDYGRGISVRPFP